MPRLKEVLSLGCLGSGCCERKRGNERVFSQSLRRRVFDIEQKCHLALSSEVPSSLGGRRIEPVVGGAADAVQ